MIRIRTALTGFPGGPGLVTQYFTTPTEDLAAVVRCREYVRDLFTSAFNIVLSSQVAWTVSHDADVITSADGHIIASFSDSANYTGGGTAGSPMGPIASAGLVRWGTGTYVLGHHLLGRSYISPLGQAVIGGTGEMNGSALTPMNVALTAWLAGLDTGDAQVIWHRPKFGVGGYSGEVTSAALQFKIAVLTSRRD